MNTFSQFWKVARLILIGFVAIIVGMGDIYGTLGYKELHAIDPERYSTENIYWFFGVVVIILAALYIYKEAKKLNQEQEG